ncbi:hypothetical protein O3P69_003382 [Scylla paramamosain]|uniref:Uncharacterized protein n=1 Tax=Scylla paramamosain TaxID=85552 RepID=A0AAW0UHP0_SCYPA
MVPHPSTPVFLAVTVSEREARVVLLSGHGRTREASLNGPPDASSASFWRGSIGFLPPRTSRWSVLRLLDTRVACVCTGLASRTKDRREKQPVSPPRVGRGDVVAVVAGVGLRGGPVPDQVRAALVTLDESTAVLRPYEYSGTFLRRTPLL